MYFGSGFLAEFLLSLSLATAFLTYINNLPSSEPAGSLQFGNVWVFICPADFKDTLIKDIGTEEDWKADITMSVS